MDILALLVSAVMTGLSVFIASYLMLKWQISAIKGDLKEEVEEWLNSDKGKNALYLIGGLISQGAKAGFGFKGTGKLRLEDIIIQLAGSYAQKFLGRQQDLSSPAPQ